MLFDRPAILSLFYNAEISHIDTVAAYPEFIIDHILHGMRHFRLPEMNSRIPKSHIRKIILHRRTYIGFPFNVIPPCLLNQKRIFQIFYISGDGCCRYFGSDHTFKSLLQFIGICQCSDCRCQYIEQRLHLTDVPDLIPRGNITDIGFLKQIIKK